MFEDWDTTDDLKKDIITAVYKDINDQVEEMVEDIGCPRSFAEGLLKSIADNFKDGTTASKNESSYSSRHDSTPEYERGAKELVLKHEKKARNTSSDFLKSFNENIKVRGNEDKTSSLYASRHISTKEEEKGAEAIVTKNEKEIRSKWIQDAKEKKSNN